MMKQRSHVLVGLALTLGCLAPSAALAREDGTTIPNCAGCHYGNGGISAPEVLLNEDLIVVAPGELTQIPISLRSSNANSFGVLIQSLGDLSASQPLITPNEVGIGHTEPLDAPEGAVDFEISFHAPAASGVTRLDFSVVAATRNSFAEDDTFGTGRLDIVYGCDPIVSYEDTDGDGFGDEETRLVSCTESRGVLVGGDCDDRDPEIFPGAVERCNFVDDNCDGAFDEGLEFNLYYEDADGDGFGQGRGEFVCREPGLSDNDDDCDDSLGAINPEAVEICNNADDNCNGVVDEECIEVEEGCDPNTGDGCGTPVATCSARATAPGGSPWTHPLMALSIALGLAGLTRRRSSRAKS